MAAKLRLGVILQGSTSWMGGLEYTRNLLKALYALPAEVQSTFTLRVLSESAVDRNLFSDMPGRFQRELCDNLAVPPLWVRAARRLAPAAFSHWCEFPRQARRLGVEFLYPFNRAAPEYRDVASAAWIPDFQHRHLPEFFTREECHARDEAFATYASNAPLVVLSSEDAAHDFRRAYPTAASKARVLPFCTAIEDAWFAVEPGTIAQKYQLPERYFIVCNQFWQHKNHRVVFEALGQLRKKGIAPILVCTGRLEDYRRPEYAREIESLLDACGIRDQVVMLGLVPRGDQVQLLRQALAVIQPSRFEGWSTVVEDARALGKRLALSDLPVHREQNPPLAHFFAALETDLLADLLARWWRELPAGPDSNAEDNARRENRIRLGQFGQRFLDLASEATRPNH